MQTASNKRTGNWDTFHSTYYWLLDLNPNFIDKNGDKPNRVPRLTGYSKKIGENEAQDKDQLLRRKIVNLFLNGYRNRCLRIKFFKSREYLINKNSDPCILILFPTHYEIPEECHDWMYKLHGQFLKDLYYAIKINADLSKLLPTTRKPVNNDEFLNPDRFSFSTLADLYAHAARCLKHGHAQGHVDHFIMQSRARMGL